MLRQNVATLTIYLQNSGHIEIAIGMKKVWKSWICAAPHVHYSRSVQTPYIGLGPYDQWQRLISWFVSLTISLFIIYLWILGGRHYFLSFVTVFYYLPHVTVMYFSGSSAYILSKLFTFFCKVCFPMHGNIVTFVCFSSKRWQLHVLHNSTKFPTFTMLFSGFSLTVHFHASAHMFWYCP